ncbi:hypothetical protein SECTIM467_18 [Brevibacillus phage SecTim467]|uniref:Uncharacterized protein n=2 Tax=Jenstvirus jenst TaxID=1982225 RepID=A0A0K2CP63_9CAUD|nr:hypothetical protein AVV11_gp173 [Brevibacillus phage Jenst]ALA07148.1 hypothetical protein JENST_18 [Brevibacillus phage Jenst]ALA07518.1 hypothetical protein SECTIM467_18 [Brevibacillus phage SecTim467]
MKTERIYLRTTPENKEYLQEVADRYFDGNMSAVFDFMVERLAIYIEEGGE